MKSRSTRTGANVDTTVDQFAVLVDENSVRVDGAHPQRSRQPAVNDMQPANDKQAAHSEQTADSLQPAEIESTQTAEIRSLHDAENRQPAVSSLQTAEAPPTVVDGNTVRVDKGSAAPLPITSASKSINCRQGSALPTRSSSSTGTIAVDAAQAQGSATSSTTSPAASTAFQARGPAGARERARPFAECYAKWVAAHVGVAGPIARDDLWHLAQQFAETSGEALPKRDNFFAAFAKVRGVERLSDKRITVFTKKGRPIEKTTAYTIAIDVPPDTGGASKSAKPVCLAA